MKLLVTYQDCLDAAKAKVESYKQPATPCCPDWPIQIALINAPVMDDCLRDGMANNVKGKPFKYCPWCGKERVLWLKA